MKRREFLGSVAALAAVGAAPARRFELGLNTYCLRFHRWSDLRLLDYCAAERLDAVFLQDSQDPAAMDPGHWSEVRARARDLGLALETGGGALLPRTPEAYPQVVATLRRHVERAAALGSPIVRALVASDRYAMPPGPVEPHVDTVVRVLREVRGQVRDAGLKIGIENHKELNAWQTRELIEAAGTDFVGSYLDTGNPVFVAEDPMTTVEELGPVAVTFHLRDSVVYEHAEGVAVQWVPLGEGTVDFPALVARAAELVPAGVRVHCKPITARPPVVLPVRSGEWWDRWFPRARAKDLARFLALAKRGRPYDRPHLTADVPDLRDRYMEALKAQQLEHMERSLEYCRRTLDLGVRWRGGPATDRDRGARRPRGPAPAARG